MEFINRVSGLALAVGLGFAGGAAQAEVPQVVTDIPPVHSLVARVMQGVGEPVLMVPPGASPHGYSLKPSEGRALSKAEIVVMVGGRLSPWLDEAADSLAPEAARVVLLGEETTIRYPFRAGHVHAHGDEDGHEEHAKEEHDHEEHAKEEHDHEEHAKEEHDHEEHAKEEHDHEEHAKEEHDHEEHAKDEHDHEEHAADLLQTDPHAWLDPENGKAWLMDVAEALAEADSENAETYRTNARAGVAEIDAAVARITPALADVKDKRFVVFHDSYQYFERRFGLSPALAIRLGDAVQPGPRRISELRAEVSAANITCAFTEPQFNAQLIDTVFENTTVRIATLDPLGVDVTPGPGLYPAVIEGIGTAIAGCLGADTE
ncbi:zinc ABC transporter substrate-binding protein [Rhodalgimonas zhirmunskyi]|uniref:High-affinity zinc uptake system protein ZnuA n=1 Tax=Rhodalgimonas zhirmunskyi TaxID=2964767 RepID=A0AAJ1UEQ7_9RHOB|nr:zinc ABC transporter substrate-binding protein [Rhodoalgimonas zhirmunskyi]MDQ2094622.1 zinc ABC transporter substrate-binding protein [Rhodoalgimonas zhirmunskyi]